MDRNSILSNTINGLPNPSKSIKAISVPPKEYPSVLTDDYASIISYVFSSNNVSFIELNKNFNIALCNSYLNIDYLTTEYLETNNLIQTEILYKDNNEYFDEIRNNQQILIRYLKNIKL